MRLLAPILIGQHRAAEGFKKAFVSTMVLRRRESIGNFIGCLLLLVAACAPVGCGVVKKKPEGEPNGLDLVGKPIPPQQAREILSELGSNFAHGPALGDTALNIGTVVLFPPYAVYLVGNALLSISGYEPITVSSILPEEDGKRWSNTYDQLVSGPGKVVAAMSGREYRSREVGKLKMQEVLKRVEAEQQKAAPAVVKGFQP